jgi:hypothetical protein
MLKTRIALGYSLQLQKSDVACSKIALRGGDESVSEWISWRSRSRPFDVFIPVVPLIKKLELAVMGGWKEESLCSLGTIKRAYGFGIREVGSLYT